MAESVAGAQQRKNNEQRYRIGEHQDLELETSSSCYFVLYFYLLTFVYDVKSNFQCPWSTPRHMYQLKYLTAESWNIVTVTFIYYLHSIWPEWETIWVTQHKPESDVWLAIHPFANWCVTISGVNRNSSCLWYRTTRFINLENRISIRFRDRPTVKD